MELMTVLWMSVVTEQDLEKIRQACYEWAILNCRLRQSDFYKIRSEKRETNTRLK